MKNKNLKNLFPGLLGAADQSRQSQQHKTQTKNGQYQIKNHYVIHALLLSKYNDSVQKPNAITIPDSIITGLNLSIQNGTTIEATATWAKSAQIEANLPSCDSVSNGAFLIKTKNNLPINYHHNTI